MVRVSVCPSLTEGLSHSQMTPGQMMAVDHCKMLPLKPSHMAARPRTPAATPPRRCRRTFSLSCEGVQVPNQPRAKKGD